MTIQMTLSNKTFIGGQAAKLRDNHCYAMFSYYYYFPALGVYGSPQNAMVRRFEIWQTDEMHSPKHFVGRVLHATLNYCS